MTALLAIENSSLDERVTFSENAIFGIERDSSHIGIRVGEILSMEECLYGMMLESANEVCLAVAEHISGSVDAFVELMNQRAAPAWLHQHPFHQSQRAAGRESLYHGP